jgi:hypothetical protein
LLCGGRRLFNGRWCLVASLGSRLLFFSPRRGLSLFFGWRRFRGWRLRRFLGFGLGGRPCGGLDRHDELADLDCVSLTDVYLRDRAGDLGGYFQGCLLGFDLEQQLGRLDGISLRDENLEDIRLLDILPKLGEPEFSHCVLPFVLS